MNASTGANIKRILLTVAFIAGLLLLLQLLLKSVVPIKNELSHIAGIVITLGFTMFAYNYIFQNFKRIYTYITIVAIWIVYIALLTTREIIK